VINYSGAAVSIEHSNSLQNRIIGGVFTGDPTTSVGVRTIGGSFNMHGTVVTVGTSISTSPWARRNTPTTSSALNPKARRRSFGQPRPPVSPSTSWATRRRARPSGRHRHRFRSVSGRFSMVDSSLNLGSPIRSSTFRTATRASSSGEMNSGPRPSRGPARSPSSAIGGRPDQSL